MQRKTLKAAQQTILKDYLSEKKQLAEQLHMASPCICVRNEYTGTCEHRYV